MTCRFALLVTIIFSIFSLSVNNNVIAQTSVASEKPSCVLVDGSGSMSALFDESRPGLRRVDVAKTIALNLAMRKELSLEFYIFGFQVLTEYFRLVQISELMTMPNPNGGTLYGKALDGLNLKDCANVVLISDLDGGSTDGIDINILPSFKAQDKKFIVILVIPPKHGRYHETIMETFSIMADYTGGDIVLINQDDLNKTISSIAKKLEK